MNLLRRMTLGVCCLCGVSSVLLAADAPSGKQRVYFGTYSGKLSKGIYRSELDLATGKLSPPVLAGEATNPSFLAIAPNVVTVVAMAVFAKRVRQPSALARPFIRGLK